MKIALILGVFALTAGVFYSAVGALTGESAAAQIASLEAQNQVALDAIESERDVLASELSQAREALDKAATEVTRLEGVEADLADLTTQVAALSESNTVLTAENAALTSQNADLSGELAEMTATLATLENASPDVDATIQTLTAEIEAARAQIATDQDRIRDLENDRAESSVYIAALEADAAANTGAQDEDLAALETRLQDMTQALDFAQAQLADDTADMQRQIADFETQIATLTEAVVDRESKIETLRTIAMLQSSQPTTGEAPTVLKTCQDRSDAILAGGTIGFESGLTSISAESIPLLESLVDIAADCVAQDLMLEIEGHTDDKGGEASNLLLSNGRATAIYDFFAARGVQADAMRAVGFGEGDPIADNATAEGRSQNRRIVFDWEYK